MPEIDFFARTNFRNEGERFWIRRGDGRLHMYSLGTSNRRQINRVKLVSHFHKGGPDAVTETAGWDLKTFPDQEWSPSTEGRDSRS